jgi:nucleoid-associated protein YgaU
LNETTPCDICTEGEAADSGTLPVSESDAPGQAPDQEQQQGEYLQANDDPNSTPEPDPSVDKTDNSTPGTTPGIDIPNPDTTQTSAPDREQASTTPLIVENASTPTAQPPETVKQYTVTIGENLYTIASRPIVYADGMLWPLIYRANRDQIKDPRQIYPGQVLNIPRDISKQDRDQARVRAEENPIFTSGGLPSQRE